MYRFYAFGNSNPGRRIFLLTCDSKYLYTYYVIIVSMSKDKKNDIKEEIKNLITSMSQDIKDLDDVSD